MFWNSVLSGLAVLTYWQTYVAGILFLFISIGPLFVVGFIMEKGGRTGGAVGCLSMLVLPFFQTFALVVFVLTMSPIILGISSEAAWRFPWQLTVSSPWIMTMFVGKLLIAALILAFIPLIGRLQSLQTLMLGSLALVSVVVIFGRLNPLIAAKHVAVWPGFLFVFGLIVVGGVMAWIGTILTAFIASIVESRFEGIGQIMLFPLSSVFGFIPLFIYGSWLGAQLK